MSIKGIILILFIGLCLGGTLGSSYGSVLYDIYNYGDLTVENTTYIGLNLTVDGNVTLERINFENNVTDHYMIDNSTCVSTVVGDTSFNVCQ